MINKVTHIGIVVEDMEKMVKFYRDTLGLRFIREDDYTPGTIIRNLKIERKGVFIDAGNTVIELLDYEPFTEKRGKKMTRETPGIAHIAFDVDDVHKTVDDLKENRPNGR